MRSLIILLITALAFTGIAIADPFMDVRGTTYLQKSVTWASGVDMTAAGGASNFNLGASTGTMTIPTTGITSAASPFRILENITLSNNKNVVLGGTGTVTAAGFVGGDTEVETLDVNNTATFGMPPALPDSGLAASDRTWTNTNIDSVIRVDAHSANVTVTLPDAAATGMLGRIIHIKTAVDPGANYVRINATGGDDIDGANYYVSTAAWGSVSVASDGTNYLTLAVNQTWSQHA